MKLIVVKDTGVKDFFNLNYYNFFIYLCYEYVSIPVYCLLYLSDILFRVLSVIFYDGNDEYIFYCFSDVFFIFIIFLFSSNNKCYALMKAQKPEQGY